MQLFCVLVFLASFFLGYNSIPARAHTHTVLELQQIAFGQFAMAGNDVPRSIIIAPNGMQTTPPGIFPFTTGQQAVFQASGDFPVTTLMTVTISDTIVSTPGGGPTFELRDFTYTPDPPVTNGSGELTLNVGATLRTDGSGTLYEDGAYTGTYLVEIMY